MLISESFKGNSQWEFTVINLKAKFDIHLHVKA